MLLYTVQLHINKPREWWDYDMARKGFVTIRIPRSALTKSRSRPRRRASNNVSLYRPLIHPNSFFGYGRTPRRIPSSNRPNGRNPYYAPLPQPRVRNVSSYSSSYGRRQSVSSRFQSSYSTPSYSSSRSVSFRRTYPSFRDYYQSYAFYKPRVLGTVRDVYRFTAPRLVAAERFAEKEARAVGGFISSRFRPKPKSIYSKTPTMLDYQGMAEGQKAIDQKARNPSPTKISGPRPVVIPMVKTRVVDGIEVYEREK